MSSPQSNSWPAPAKLNLFLHITARRADGYHLLQSIFQFLDYGDELHFTLRDDGEITLSAPLPGVPVESDLVVRAARLLQRETNTSYGAEIRVEKRLPMGGGLGGGSSDAATTLHALNKLWGLGLETTRLAELGLSLGADVPIFVNGYAAWAEGVGELLTPVEPQESWYLVVVPPVSVPTAEIFSAPELTRDLPAIKIRDFLAGRGINVCEPVVCHRYPEVGRALDWLRQFGPAMMTGTGASLFVPMPDRRRAEEILGNLPGEWAGFVARGCNRSPLLRRLEREAATATPAGVEQSTGA